MLKSVFLLKNNVANSCHKFCIDSNTLRSNRLTKCIFGATDMLNLLEKRQIKNIKIVTTPRNYAFFFGFTEICCPIVVL